MLHLFGLGLPLLADLLSSLMLLLRFLLLLVLQLHLLLLLLLPRLRLLLLLLLLLFLRLLLLPLPLMMFFLLVMMQLTLLRHTGAVRHYHVVFEMVPLLLLSSLHLRPSCLTPRHRCCLLLSASAVCRP